MKKFKFLATMFAFISSSLFVSCDAITSLADVDINTNYIVDIPVELVNADMQSCEFSMSLADIDDLSEYLDKLKDLKIEDIELSVLNYQGDEFNGDLTLTVDGETLWSKEDVNPETIGTISLQEEQENLNQATLNQLGLKLLSGKDVKGGLIVETESTDPITASFTVRCKFIMEITANPL